MKRITESPKQPPVRLNRYLSMCGVSSRRKADDLILEGKVEVNRKTIRELGAKINPQSDRVFVEGKEATIVHEYIYLVMNKPKDTITTLRDERGRTTVLSLLRTKQRVYPIGRLDRNTTGVLLFTNDGEFAHRLMHPKYRIKKSYQVRCTTPVHRLDLEKLRSGVVLDDGKTEKAEVVAIPGGKGKEIGIIIHEGRNRQVRRMFETLGYEVAKLDRVAYGPVTREGLPRGRSRSLSAAEIRALKRLAGINESKGAV